jgi:hypothetical protein
LCSLPVADVLRRLVAIIELRAGKAPPRTQEIIKAGRRACDADAQLLCAPTMPTPLGQR